MRVTMVITSYHPIIGGAERQLAQLARRFAAGGHAVTVVTRHHPGLMRRETIEGVEVVRIPSGGAKPLRKLGFLIEAARAVRASRPDVIHCHSLFSPALAGILGAPRAVPVLAKPMCGGEASDIAAKPLGKLRMAFYRRGLARLIAISGEIRDELLALGFPRQCIAEIPNGVDLDRFHPATEPARRREARLALGLPEAGFVLAYAGRLAAQKRLPMLLQAFHNLADRHPELHLAIAGANRSAGREASVGGEEDRHLPPALLQHPRLHLLGQVDDMPAFLAAVDGFVLPSSREGLSNALLEACAAGLPSVSARIGGNVELVEEGRGGFLFAPDDEDDLTRAVEALIADPEAARAMGQAARRRVEEGFSLSVTAARLEALYADLAGGGGR